MVILKVMQAENSWTAADLICYIYDFLVIQKPGFEQKHYVICVSLFDYCYSLTGFENGG
jgi:hypothetical protein